MPTPTRLEYALMSYQAYRPTEENELLPAGWSRDPILVQPNTTAGFDATVWTRDNGQDVVVAFRGTDFPESWGTLPGGEIDFFYGNIDGADGSYSEQIMRAIYLVATVIEEYGKENVRLTGHSLGGGIAGVVAAFFKLEAYVFAPAPFANNAMDRYIDLSPPFPSVEPGAVQEYFYRYSQRQLLLNRPIDPDFLEYATVFAGANTAAEETLFGQREELVTGTYLDGEALESLRNLLPTVGGANLDPIDIGVTTLHDPAGIFTLHDMLLHAAFVASDQLQYASQGLPSLAELMTDRSLYGQSRSSTTASFLKKLLSEQVAPGVTPGTGALDRFAADVLRIGGGLTLDEGVRDGIIAATIEHYYDALPTETDPFISAAGGQLTFDVTQLKQRGASDKGLVRLVDAVSTLAAQSGPLAGGTSVTRGVATDATKWTVITGTGAQQTTGDAADEVQIGSAQASSNRLNGGEGNDVLLAVATGFLHGEGGNDALIGSSDNDVLEGGDGADELAAGGGNDTLKGGSGTDHLYGGTGFDTYRFADGDGNDTIWDTLGQGVIEFNGANLAVTKRIAENVWEANEGQLTIERTLNNAQVPGVYTLTIRNSTNSTVVTVQNWMAGQLNLTLSNTVIEPPTAPPTTTTIVGDFRILDDDPDEPGVQPTYDELGNRVNDGEPQDVRDWLNGNAADNEIIGGALGDVLLAGAGNDVVFGGSVVNMADAIADGALGEGSAPLVIDLLTGGNLLGGNAGDDVLVGTLENELLAGGGGSDLLIGGQGEDLLMGDYEISPYFEDWSFDWQATNQGPNYFLGLVTVAHESLSPGNDVIHAGGGADHVLAGLGNDVVHGEGGDDVLYGDGGQDRLYGGTGNDHINGYTLIADGEPDPAADGGDFLDGGDGEDELQGSSGADVMFGGADNDLMFGDDLSEDEHGGDDVLDGGDGNDSMWGRAGSDTLIGGAGNDTMVGESAEIEAGFHGSDYLDGGDDADELWGGGGSDTLIGGSGNDTLSGDMIDIDDELHGDDYLDGGSGNDTLWGEGGSDTLFGGADNDQLAGDTSDAPAEFQGDDYLDGGDGNDSLWGRGGADILIGGSGNDELAGDSSLTDPELQGDDYLDGGEGIDVLLGAGGNDTLYGGTGADFLDGDSGITAGELQGDDYLDGGAGADVMDGGGGDDWLIGGEDNDELVGDYLAGLAAEFQGNDYLDGGAGNDTLSGGGGADTLIGGAGTDILRGDASNTPAEAHGNDYIDGGEGNDTIFGWGGSDTLFGGDGNDVLEGDESSLPAGLQGADYLDGGSGDDVVQGGGGDDFLRGGTGNDTLDGDAGNDTLEGGLGVDTLFGGAGDDVYIFSADEFEVNGSAMDVVSDSSGNDTVLITGGLALDDIEVTKQAGSNSLFLAANGSSASVRISNVFNGLSSVRTIRFGDEVATTDRLFAERYAGVQLLGTSVAYANLWGGMFSDNLSGTGEGATISGGWGNDTLVGGQNQSTTYLFTYGDGNDTISDVSVQSGGSGPKNVLALTDVAFADLTLRYRPGIDADLIVANNGGSIQLSTFSNTDVIGVRTIDEIRFGDGTVMTWADFVTASGVDIESSSGSVIDGTSVADRIVASSSDETINSGAGNDTLDGRAGDDTLDGGSGSDTYVFRLGDGRDVINNTDAAAGKVDRLLLADLNRSQLLFLRHEDTLLIRVVGAADRVLIPNYFAGAGLDEIRTADDVVYTPSTVVLDSPSSLATTGADDIFGTAGNDTIDALAGNDFVMAGAGDDIVYGSEGDDALYGDTGDDVLESGAGANTLHGGAGNDTLLGNVASWDLLYGDAGADEISGSGLLDGGEGDDVLTSAGASGTDLFGGAGNDQLFGSSADDETLTGGDGNDLLDSGGGSGDRLVGGEGNDTYLVSNGADLLIVQDDAGVGRLDTLRFGSGILPSQIQFEANWQGTLTLFVDEPGLSLSVDLVGYLLDDEPTKKLDRIEFDANPGTVWTGAQLEGFAFVPTNNDQYIRGTPNDDVINGLGGTDDLHGRDGNDQLFGGADGDRLYGEAGNDTLTGGAGFDDLDGGAGSDTYFYGLGDGDDEILGNLDTAPESIDEVLFGPGIGPGNVTVRSGFDSPDDLILRVYDPLTGSLSGSIEVHLGLSSSVLDRVRFADSPGTVWLQSDFEDLMVTGANGADWIVGTSANEIIRGYAGDDRLDGAGGNDDLAGGAGNDRLLGGAGDDTIRFGLGQGIDHVADSGGTNRIVLDVGITPGDVTLRRVVNTSLPGGDGFLPPATSDGLALGLAGGADQLIVHSFFTTQPTRPITEIVFADGTIWDVAYIEANTVSTITIVGTAGDDNLVGTSDDEGLLGFAGNDTLDGGAGEDTLDGGEGNDVLRGGRGDDVLLGGAGDDRFEGGLGEDTYRFAALEGHDRLADIGGHNRIEFELGSGITLADLATTRVGDDLRLSIGDDSLTLEGWYDLAGGPAGQMEFVFYEDGLPWVYGDRQIGDRFGYGDTSPYAGQPGPLLVAKEGEFFSYQVPINFFTDIESQDTLTYSASALPAWLTFDPATRTYSGTPPATASGAEIFFQVEVDDGVNTDWRYFTLHTRPNLQTLTGNEQDNVLTGGSLADYVLAGAGNDTVQAGGGSNVIDGGAGNDLITTTAADIIYGGDGNDIIQGSSFHSRQVSGGAGDDRIDISSGSGSYSGDSGDDYIRGSGSLSGGAGDDELYGGSNGDNFHGNDGDDYIEAFDGADTLFGDQGNDTLLGGLGDDDIIGDWGDDIIDGGRHNDDLRGGVGDDRYVGFWSLSNDDFVWDSSGFDTLEFRNDVDTLIGSFAVTTLSGGTSSIAIELGTTGTTIRIATDNQPGLGLPNIEQFILYAGGLPYRYSAQQIAGLATGTNTGPAVNAPMANQVLFPDQPFALELPANLFTDAESQLSLVYSAALTDGSPLPSWLSFSASTRALSGTPAVSDVGVIRIQITATDAGSLSAATGVWLDVAAPRVLGTAEGDSLSGTSAGEVVIGAAGNDVLDAGAGDDIVEGGSGDDSLDGGSGGDYLAGGSGDDVYYFDSSADVANEDADEGTDEIISAVDTVLPDHIENLELVGSATNGTGNRLANTIIGNALNNALDGGNGNDVLDGGQGADTLRGGLGEDSYYVDNASDVVIDILSDQDFGEDTVYSTVSWGDASSLIERIVLLGTADINATGGSFLYGNAGNNTLDGGNGDDELVGGLGNDVYIVNSSGDQVVELPGEGIDTVQSSSTATFATAFALSANVENLTLTGFAAHSGTGNELDNTITGNSGANTLNGGDGNDTLNGGSGNDAMTGGRGNDFYFVGQSGDTVTELADEGIDTVQATITFTLGGNIENLTFTGSSGLAGTGNALANVLVGNSGANTLTGLAGNDTLDGGSGNDTLVGGLGDDTYVVAQTADIVNEAAGEGTDTVYSSATTYTLSSNVENLVLTPGTSNIGGTGNSGANTLTGNSGNNALSGGAGADTMLGGAGNDTYTVDDAGDVVTENAGEGTDLVNSSVNYTLADVDVENLTLTSTAATGTGNSGDNVLTGNGSNNTLTGLEGNDTLDGMAGNDTLIGGQGNDTYIFGTGDTITENSGEGIDLVQSSVTHTLGNNLENLLLTGSSIINGTGNALDNVLTGNGQNNTLTGNDGNDTLNGNGGTDTMVGGAGNDVYYIDGSTDVTTESASAGFDTINSSITKTLVSNIEALFLTGSSAINATGLTTANLLRGNTGTNTINGAGGTDILEGGAGTDTLQNTVSANTLMNGGADNDTLTGTASNDLLIGGLGNDSITTGQGADIIAFNQGEGADTVASSTTKDNVLSLGGGILYADLLFQKSGNNLILKAGGTDQITFTNYYSSSSNRSVDKLQIVIEGTSDYDSGSADALRNKKIATFNFDGLVAAFDAALVANPGLTTWALTNALVAQHLGGSDTAAIGGDLAYRYGRFDSLSDISFTPAVAILAAAGFGTTAQTLQSLASLQDSSARLS